MLKKVGVVIAVAAVLLGGGFGLRAYMNHREVKRIDTVRGRMLDGYVMASEMWGRADTLVLGDSLLAGSPIDCGRVFTMTVPTVTASEMLKRGRTVADRIKPRIVVISLGTNDAYWNETAPVLEEVRRWPEKVLWIAPVKAPAADQRIERIAHDRGEWVYRYDGKTTDGTHPDLAGRQQIRAKISDRCKAALAAGA